MKLEKSYFVFAFVALISAILGGLLAHLPFMSLKLTFSVSDPDDVNKVVQVVPSSPLQSVDHSSLLLNSIVTSSFQDDEWCGGGLCMKIQIPCDGTGEFDPSQGVQCPAGCDGDVHGCICMNGQGVCCDGF